MTTLSTLNPPQPGTHCFLRTPTGQRRRVTVQLVSDCGRYARVTFAGGTTEHLVQVRRLEAVGSQQVAQSHSPTPTPHLP